MGQEDCSDPQDIDGDGWTLEDGDCNDHDPDVHPGAEELCDGVDNDCDGTADSGEAGTSEACAVESCLALYQVAPDSADGLYWIDPLQSGSPFEAYCDMTHDGGGWTLVVRAHNGETGEHRNQEAVGTLTSPDQDTTAKLSDTVINALRGDSYSSSIFLMWLADDTKDYFRDSRAFNALGYTDSINTVYDTYEDALNQTGACSGTYNSTIHTGLVGWECHDYFIYSDAPGMRNHTYQAGAVYVKALE